METGPRPDGICSVRAELLTVRPTGCAATRTTPYIRTGDAWLQQSMKLTTLFMSPVAKGWTRILA